MFDKQALENPAVNHDVLWNVICGTIGYPAMFVAHELNLFSLLNETPLTLTEITAQLATDHRATDALLAVNLSLGLLTKDDSERYRITETSRVYLLADSPTYMGNFLNLVISGSKSISIDALRQTIRTGATQAYDGEDIFASHADPAQMERARNFTRAMHSASVAPAMYWPEKLDLSKHHYMLDIGGGSGAHTMGALNHWPKLSGGIFDMAPVCEVATEIATENGFEERFFTHQGDLWKDNFPDADLHFYSQIFHDWPWDKCQFLADKSFKHLPSGGRIILHEKLYNDDKAGPFIAAASSVGMLLWTEGRQYSGQELTKILEQAGFINIETANTFSCWSIVSGTKP